MKSIARESRLKGCPCCGAASRTDECKVCEWRRDGLDNDRAFQYSYLNKTNLNLARYLFLKNGRAAAFKVEGFSRDFRIDESGGFIEEFALDGTRLYRGPIPFVDYASHGDEVAAMPLRRGAKK